MPFASPTDWQNSPESHGYDCDEPPCAGAIWPGYRALAGAWTGSDGRAVVCGQVCVDCEESRPNPGLCNTRTICGRHFWSTMILQLGTELPFRSTDGLSGYPAVDLRHGIYSGDEIHH